MIYDAAAYFSRPIDGLERRTSRDDRQDRVDAETPEAAARKWLWRLTEEQRAATVRLVVFAPKPRFGPYYAGEPVRFLREGGKLVELQA